MYSKDNVVCGIEKFIIRDISSNLVSGSVYYKCDKIIIST
jgi:hypothetical protein